MVWICIAQATTDLGQDLMRRLDECERKVHNLILHMNMVSDLIKLLKERSQAESEDNPAES